MDLDKVKLVYGLKYKEPNSTSNNDEKFDKEFNDVLVALKSVCQSTGGLFFKCSSQIRPI